MAFKWFWPFKHKKKLSAVNTHQITAAAKRYIPVNQLTLGLYVVELDRSWLDTPFLFQGFEIKTHAQIQALQNICDYVYIDTSKTRVSKHPSFTNNAKNQPEFGSKILGAIDFQKEPPKKLGTFQSEFPRAEAVYKNTGDLIERFMKTAAKQGSIDGWLAKKAVSECVNSALHSPDALLWMLHLKNKDEYTVQHCLNVCVLAIVFARYLDLPYETIVNLGVCGLLHDIGNILIPDNILNKESDLTEQEKWLLESHTTLGYELLKSSEHIHASILETVLAHHENLDGSGYPRNLKSKQISDFTKIISVVNTYDALTKNRFPHRNTNHLEAIQLMSNMVGTQLDRRLVTKFIECLGVYPAGAVVMMTNGAIAIVVEVNEKTKLRPKVVIVFDEHKKPVPEKMIDLSNMVTDSNGTIYTIKNVVKAEDWQVDRNQYYEQGLFKKSFNRA